MGATKFIWNPIYRGDTFAAKNGICKQEGTNTPHDITGATIVMTIRANNCHGKQIKTASTADGGIVITNAVGGLFTINQFNTDNTWSEGTYHVSIVFTIAGVVLTKGNGSFNVLTI